MVSTTWAVAWPVCAAQSPSRWGGHAAQAWWALGMCTATGLWRPLREAR